MANIIRTGGGGGGSTPTLIAKSITQNGTYLAQDDNADGYSSVEVDVAGGGGVSTNVPVHSGKINLSTGEIVADEAYCYTDEFPCPNGSVMFDMGLTGSQTYAGAISYDENGVRKGSADASSRYRVVNLATVYSSGARTLRLSFPIAHIEDVILKDYVNEVTYTTNPVIIGDSEGVEYADLSSFAFYYRKNTSTPTVTPISSNEVSLTFQDQNASGYELSSYSVSLEKGVYVAEIKATVNKNTGLANQYTWGIYSANTTSGAQENSADVKSKGYTTYVPFDKTDTNEHYDEVPINVTADGTAYICFAMADDNGVNATVTVSSLKIRKAYGVESGGIDYIESWIINSKSSVAIPTTTTHIEYTDGAMSSFDVADNAGNETVTMGDITTFIGNASGFYWWVTANDDMTYRIYNVLTGELGELQTASSGDRIIDDGDIDVPYCMEIRRYS